MPELPEVEIFTRYFCRTSLQKTIRSVEVRAPGILDGISADEVSRILKGRTFVSASRYGKNLLADISGGGCLTIHFGMSGYLSFFNDLSDDTPHDRFLISFDDGYLAYDNRRMIGKIGFAHSRDEFVSAKGLGPDFLSVDENDFVSALSRKKGPVKSALMDQAAVAGIGNEYTDEILFQARMHPKTPVQSLSPEELPRIFGIARKVIGAAIEADADHDRFPEEFFLRSRRRSDTCPRCGSRISMIKVGGRSSYVCSACQK